MSGARGDALEWALALARAPGERHALRQRPLPDGIEPLLQIAAGRQGEVLQEALARSGEPEAELVEAVRFYLREVLFHSGADAYRMLGLAHDASAEQIKAHHRLLQQWLHPDRHTSDWDAIFAGRVNAAWNVLRSPERRAEYDATHPAAIDTTPAAARWAAPRVLADAPLADDDNATRWRRRAPVLALFAACGILGVAAMRDALREPEGRYGAQSADERSAASESGQIALRLPQPAATAAGKPAAPPRRKPAGDAQPIATRTPSLKMQEETRKAPAMPTIAARAAPATTTMVAMPTPPAVREIAPAALPPPMSAPVAVATPPIATSDVPVRAPVRIATTPVPSPVAIALPQAPIEVASPERVQQAQRTGRQLLAFLSARSGALPPIWDSLAAQQRAVRLRDSLHASGDTRAGDPQWRVEPEDAALQAAFGDNAQVRAQLVWREQRWLVSGVALEQAP